MPETSTLLNANCLDIADAANSEIKLYLFHRAADALCRIAGFSFSYKSLAVCFANRLFIRGKCERKISKIFSEQGGDSLFRNMAHSYCRFTLDERFSGRIKRCSHQASAFSFAAYHRRFPCFKCKT